MSSKSKMPSPNKTPRPTMSFNEMVGNTMVKKLEGQVDMKIQQAAFEVQRRLAQQQLAFQASITTDLAAIKDLLIEKGLMTDATHRERVWKIEDKAFGAEPLPEGDSAQKGDRVRGLLSFKDQSGPHEQPITISHLAQDPRVLMGSLEEYLIGRLEGETVELPNPAEGVSEVKVQIMKLSRPIPVPAPQAPQAETPAPEAAAPPEESTEQEG